MKTKAYKKPASSFSLGQRLRGLHFALFFVFAFGMGFGTGCAKAPKSDGEFTTKCQIPEDQSGTMTGAWPLTPVPVGFKQLNSSGNFSGSEMTQIVQAASTWNAFYARSKGFPLLNIGSAASPKQVTSADKAQIYSQCNVPLLNSSGFGNESHPEVDTVVLHKMDTTWSHASPSAEQDLIAITGLCTYNQEHGVGAQINYSWIELNYVDFFQAGKKQPDLESLLLHEFGHLIGLDHSCEASGGSGIPYCQVKKEYDQAVMFPTVIFNGLQGELRRVLKLNDQYRANCLY